MSNQSVSSSAAYSNISDHCTRLWRWTTTAAGIEVAGVALAVFPIVITGLTQFRQGVQSIRHWRRYHTELKNYARVLQSHHMFYLDTLEELLMGVVASDDDRALMKPNLEVRCGRGQNTSSDCDDSLPDFTNLTLIL